MRALAAMIAVIMSLGGCSALKVIGFKPAAGSGERIGQVDVFLSGQVRDEEQKRKFDEVTASFRQDPTFDKAATDGKCIDKEVRPRDTITALWLSAVGKLVFDLYADSLSRLVERLKAAASPPAYGRRIIVSGQELFDANCALIVRRRANEVTGSLPGLVALLKIEKAGKKAFSIRPIYVRATSAVAVTAPAKSPDQRPTIHIAFGVSTKAIGEGDSKLPTVAVVGLGGVSVQQVRVGNNSDPMCTKEDCPKSDLIAYPPKDDVASFSLTVSEVGNVGFDLDATAAQITAIKAAIGPAISDLLKEKAK